MISTEAVNFGAGLSGSSKRNDSLIGKEDFLKLLLAQMQNQDPLNPMDSMEFTNQLTQFGELEQLYNIDENIQYLNLLQSSQINTQAINFIDKTVKALGNSVYIEEGKGGDIHYDLAGESKEVTAKIYDNAGNLIKSIVDCPNNSGRHTIEWDGTDQQGEKVLEGRYLFEISAEGYDGEPVGVTHFIVGKVSKLTFLEGSAYLEVGRELIAIGDVMEIEGAL